MEPRQEIEAQRQEIDRIDDAIVDLLVRRARCAVAIGRQKRLEGSPIRDPAREASVLARLRDRARGSLDGRAVESIFEKIMQVSRALEEEDVRP
jgi:chorismate mutase/prephenate dehydratase